MTLYLTIITTALVITQIIRIAQNAINLHRSNKVFEAEVKHGHWKDNNNGTFTCSECGGRASKMDWCGCCGAKMDGKKVE